MRHYFLEITIRKCLVLVVKGGLSYAFCRIFRSYSAVWGEESATSTNNSRRSRHFVIKSCLRNCIYLDSFQHVYCENHHYIFFFFDCSKENFSRMHKRRFLASPIVHLVLRSPTLSNSNDSGIRVLFGGLFCDPLRRMCPRPLYAFLTKPRSKRTLDLKNKCAKSIDMFISPPVAVRFAKPMRIPFWQ